MMTNQSADKDLQPEALKPEDWAGEMGLKWLANLAVFEEMIAPIGEAFMAHADFQPGETVIDLGCGGGATTVAIAEAIAPSGTVSGVDISPDLVVAAEQRAIGVGAKNLEFLCADAASVVLPAAPYDRLFSRFGSMFFDEPFSAFANLHRLVRKGGRVDLAVWGAPRENPWMMEMIGVVKKHVEIPAGIPRAPGPFAFEDLEYLGEILDESGFRNVDIVAHEGLQPVGGAGATPEKALEFAFAAPAVGRSLKDKDEAIIRAVSQELIDHFAQYHVPGQGVMMKGKVWFVSAIA